MITQGENDKSELVYCLAAIYYAVMLADGKIALKEADTLKSILLGFTRVGNPFTFSNKETCQVLEKVREFFKKNIEIETALKLVKECIERQPILCSPAYKTVILSSGHALAASFAQKNKSELIVLAKIAVLLK